MYLFQFKPGGRVGLALVDWDPRNVFDSDNTAGGQYWGVYVMRPCGHVVEEDSALVCGYSARLPEARAFNSLQGFACRGGFRK